jgi:hypothetical protein
MAGINGTFCIEGCVEKLTYWPGQEPGGELLPPQVTTWEGAGFNDTFPLRLKAFIDDVANDVPKDHLRASGRDALATLEYTFAAIKSFEESGAVVRPDPLPILHGHPKYVW